jgi:hypothetical protein
MKRRMIFSGSVDFCLYDFYTVEGYVNENVFAYSNRLGDDRALVFYNNSYNQTSGWIHRGAVAIPQKNGGVKQDSFSQALSLHYDGRFFTLLREHRSNLWFIRSSKEIMEKGLFVALNGYEAQVFMDIHEVEDASGRWARLHVELNGRGVPDLYASLQDLFLGELYAPFAQLVTPERINSFYALCAKAKGADEQAFFTALKEPALAFATVAANYLCGAQGKYDPFNAARMEYPTFAPEQVCEDFIERLKRFIDFAAKQPAASMTFIATLREKVIANPHISAFAMGYALLATLRSVVGQGASGAEASALAVHWSLDRKIKEACCAFGASGEEAYWINEVAKAVLARTCPENVAMYEDGPFAAKVIVENYQAADFKCLLQVNRFNDVTWFNKEAFERVLFYAPLFLLMENEDAFAEAACVKAKPAHKAQKAHKQDSAALHEAIERIADAFRKAETTSGYRFDTLLEALSESGTDTIKPAAKKSRRTGA